MIKLFSYVKTKKDKTFSTPKRFVKAGSFGYVVEALSNIEPFEYLVEINNNVYEYFEEELEIQYK